MKIQVQNLTKVFKPRRGEVVHAVDDVSIEVDDAEFLVILGPSGSGKTTLLRCIAGLERADYGEIHIDGRCVFSAEKRVWVPPERRGVNMVFQSYALWPHMTVFDNVAYPLRTKRRRSEPIRDEVERALSLVGCGGLEQRYPGQLSGGQQQRVAVARAIVGGNSVVLFDEPLSAVDARVREELRHELVRLQKELGFASIYITHDQTEASMMGHRVAVLADGKIRQLDSPREVYERPNSLFVAEFMGAANRYEPLSSEQFEKLGDGVVRVPLAFGTIDAKVSPDLNGHAEVVVIFRPERCRVTAERPADSSANVWECTVEQSLFLGFCTEYQVQVNGVRLLVRSMERRTLPEQTTAWLSIDPDDVHLVPGG
jgi:iron(III) transport system ATP-binding protein